MGIALLTINRPLNPLNSQVFRDWEVVGELSRPGGQSGGVRIGERLLLLSRHTEIGIVSRCTILCLVLSHFLPLFRASPPYSHSGLTRRWLWLFNRDFRIASQSAKFAQPKLTWDHPGGEAPASSPAYQHG